MCTYPFDRKEVRECGRARSPQFGPSCNLPLQASRERVIRIALSTVANLLSVGLVRSCGCPIHDFYFTSRDRSSCCGCLETNCERFAPSFSFNRLVLGSLRNGRTIERRQSRRVLLGTSGVTSCLSRMGFPDGSLHLDGKLVVRFGAGVRGVRGQGRGWLHRVVEVVR